MFWALLAILGVPVWLVVGALAASLWNRNQFKKTSGVFPVKVRLKSGSFSGLGDKWPRGLSYALWIHDVLLLQKGFALIRTIPIPVATVERPVQDADPETVKKMGDNPLLYTFKLDNGAVMETAVSTDNRVLAVGPFEETNQ